MSQIIIVKCSCRIEHRLATNQSLVSFVLDQVDGVSPRLYFAGSAASMLPLFLMSNSSQAPYLLEQRIYPSSECLLIPSFPPFFTTLFKNYKIKYVTTTFLMPPTTHHQSTIQHSLFCFKSPANPPSTFNPMKPISRLLISSRVTWRTVQEKTKTVESRHYCYPGYHDSTPLSCFITHHNRPMAAHLTCLSSSTLL